MSIETAKPAKMIGVKVPLIDGFEKVSGRAEYTADLAHTGALVGRIYRSPYSHADILKLDVSKALALPGVVTIVTGDDCDVPYGILPIAQNEYPLARERVRYRGEPDDPHHAFSPTVFHPRTYLVVSGNPIPGCLLDACDARVQNTGQGLCFWEAISRLPAVSHLNREADAVAGTRGVGLE